MTSAASGGRADRIISSYVRPNTGYRKHNIAVDSTGLNLSKTTLWRENKGGGGPNRRGWLKVHAAVDSESGEILAYILTDDSVGDNRAFIPLMRMLLGEGYSIGTVYADNAYEAIDNWKFLDGEKIRFVVKFSSDTTGNSNGCMARGESAQLWVQLGEKKWKKLKEYGRRWKAECAFSDLKRLTAETVSATTAEGIEREVRMKVLAYNRHKRVRADVISITWNDVLIAED
jgi:transposase